MATSWLRMQDLIKTRARLYNHSYNPLNIRTGAKILREKLKGPIVAAYYPPRPHTYRDLRKAFPMLELFDDKQGEREDAIAIIKARGKGAPKKKRSAAESKRNKGRSKAKPVVAKPT